MPGGGGGGGWKRSVLTWGGYFCVVLSFFSPLQEVYPFSEFLCPLLDGAVSGSDMWAEPLKLGEGQMGFLGRGINQRGRVTETDSSRITLHPADGAAV